VVNNAHGGNGEFVQTQENAERDAEATRLRARGMTYREIGLIFGITDKTAQKAVKRNLQRIAVDAVEDLRQVENLRLDAMEQSVLAVLETKHFTVTQRGIVYNGSEPLVDDLPVLQAVDRLLRIQQRRASLNGLDNPQKIEVNLKHGDLDLDAELDAFARGAAAARSESDVEEHGA